MTASDDAILELMFNPEAQEMPLDSYSKPFSSDQAAIEIDPALLEQLKNLENEAVTLAEQDKTDEALKVIDQCIEKESKYASAYNNRAQIYRIRGDLELALKDLDTVINLAAGQPKVLSQAYTQRAIIRRQQGDLEGSKKDFQLGAQCGNPIARNITISENPYAKLCNQMMMEVMSREFSHGTQ